MKRLLLATLVFGGLFPAAMAQSPPPASILPAPAAAEITTAADFVPLAAASNRFEIESSRLALERAQSADIRSFAQRMVEEHGAAAGRLEAAAAEAGLTLPAELDETRQAMLDELSASSGEAFDTLYAQMQIQAHDQSVALFQGFSQAGEPGPVRDFAAAALPVLQEHQALAQGMSRT